MTALPLLPLPHTQVNTGCTATTKPQKHLAGRKRPKPSTREPGTLGSPPPAAGLHVAAQRPPCPRGAVYSPQAAPAPMSEERQPWDTFWALSPPKTVLRGQVISSPVPTGTWQAWAQIQGPQTIGIYMEVLCSIFQPGTPANTHLLILTHRVRISLCGFKACRKLPAWPPRPR